MLSRLQIENIAIVETAEIEFEAGLNTITGETGAGKSIMIAALELALGGRGSADAIRAGKTVASVEASFEPPFSRAVSRLIQKELELEWEPGETLTVRREISNQGRSRCFIAGQMTGVTELRRLGELLLDMHGQHEHQSLFHLAAQREALDAFGQHEKLLEEYRGRHEIHAALERRSAELAAQARDFEKRMDFLTFQIGEIEELNPAEGEREELEAEEARLANADALANAAGQAYGLLYEGMGEEGVSALSLMREAARALGRITDLDTGMTGLGEKAGEIEALVEDLALTLRDYANRCQADPERLAQVIERSEALRRLRRKHGAENDGALLAILEGLKAERDRMQLDQREREEIDGRIASAAKTLRQNAERLTKARVEAAKKLGQTVTRTLGKIGMEKARFEVEIQPVDFTADGADRIEFLLAANVGEGRKSLRETASGGELSRTMLAIKTALAERDAIPTLIFDEIDAGISGETAARVGGVLAELAASHQILCITHHAAIAARGQRHLSVRKFTQGGRTLVSAVPLAKGERLEELARMMGGDGASAAGRKLAEQLLAAK